jgi:tetratricopeptide (TPR) repeat protein
MEAYNALGFALESMNEDSEAVRNYHRAVELSEERGAGFLSPYVNLAAHYNRLNQPSLALEHASEALAIDPDSDLALFQAAKAYRAEKRWDEAVSHLERAISINARVSRYHYVLGLLYRRLGQAEKSRSAIGAFERLEREAAELETRRRESRRSAR